MFSKHLKPRISRPESVSQQPLLPRRRPKGGVSARAPVEEQIAALHEINVAITSTLDLSSVLDTLLDKIHALIPYASATGIRLLNQDGLLEPVICRNVDPRVWDNEMRRAGPGITREAMETQVPIIVKNLQQDPRVLPSQFASVLNLVSCIVIPLIAKGEPLGVLTFYTREEHEFVPGEIDFLSAIARQAAVAIYNSRIYDEIKKQKAEMESANRELESAREQLETEVKRRNQINRVLHRLASIVQQSDDAIIGTTIGGLVTSWNRGAQKMFGYSAAEVVGRSFHTLLPPECDERVRRLFEACKSGARAHAYEDAVIRRKDGTPVHIALNLSPVRDTTAKVHAVSAIIRDVTERKKAEAERDRYTAQLQGLADAAVTVNSSLTLDQLLRVVTEKAREIIGAHQSVTSTWDDEKRSPSGHAFSLSEKYDAYRNFTAKPDGSGIYSLVCENNRPMRLTQAELEAHPRFRRFGPYAGQHPPMRGWLCAPLIGRDGHNIGILQVSDKYEGEFTAGDEAILAQLAQMASVAIQNARLLANEAALRKIAEQEAEEKKKAEQRVAALHELNVAMTSTLDLKSILDILMEKVEVFLPYAAAHVRLRDPATGVMKLLACRNIDEKAWKSLPTRAPGAVVTTILETRAPLTIKNLLRDERVRNRSFVEHEGLVSYLGVPLIANGEVLGVLSFYTREEHEFAEAEIDFLSSLTRHAAIAIYNSRLYEKIKNQRTELLQAVVQLETTGQELEARLRELECLHQINQEILNSSDLEAILAKILGRAMSIGSFHLGVVRLWNPNKTVLEPVVREGLHHPERLQSYSALFLDQNRATLVSRALSERQTAIEGNVQRAEGLQVLKAEGVEVALAVPVIAENDVLGILLLGSRNPRQLDANLVRLIETIGNQLGLAVQKIRFQQQTQHNLERVKGLHEINRATTSTLELDSVLDLLLEKIVSILPYSAAGIRLMDKQRGFLEPVACRNMDPAAWKTLGASNPGRLSGLVFTTTEPIVIPNMLEDPRTTSLRLFHKEGLVSYLGIPLIAKGERIGVLSLYTRIQHDFTDEEIAYVSTLADQAAIAIQNSQLYEEARKLSRDLLSSRSQIRTLMSGIVKAKDEEARRIARELHDESGQLLAAVHISLGEMAKNLPVEFDHQIRQTKELLKQVENRLRDLSHELHPSVLDDLGLVPGLEFLAQRLSRRAGIEITTAASLRRRLSQLHEITLYRVVQEALNNVARHSQASSARVFLCHWNGSIQCSIEDDGEGFDVEPVMERTTVEGLGLLGMRERVAALGGAFEIQSSRGTGTKIIVTLPGEG